MLNILPVFEEDVFLKYRPFPAETNNLFVAHWHEIVGSWAFYQVLMGVLPFISLRAFGKTYTSLDKKGRINFDIHIVAFVQSIISVTILIPMWNHSYWVNHRQSPYDAVLGYTPYGGFVAATTVGYFVWDLIICVQYLQLFGVAFLLHAFAALYVFATTFVPFCMPWIPAFLLFELSSPFVNINWFASKLPAGTFSETFVLINGLFLLITFFSVRILWGFYAVFLVASDMYATRDQVHFIFPLTILSLNFMLNVLNVLWFVKMVKIARKKLNAKQPVPPAEKVATGKLE